MVPGCWEAENPEPPNKELEPPKGLEVVLVEPNRPAPPLVLVPKSEGHKEKLMVLVLNRSDSELQEHS